VYRTSFAQAKEDSLLLVVEKDVFLNAMKLSPAVEEEV
jgi:CRP-like cAMP-binding protein